MKKILTILLLMISINSFGQLAPPVKKITLNLPTTQTNSKIAGPTLMAGGAAFILAGLLTPPNMVAGSTTQKQPPIKQIQKIAPIVSGGIVFVIGLGITIGN